MDDENNLQSSIGNGFLIQGLLWGIAIGYTVADLQSATKGFLFLGTTHGNVVFVTVVIIALPTLGLIGGFAIDCMKIEKQERYELLRNSRRCLVGYAAFYFIMALMANLPTVQ